MIRLYEQVVRKEEEPKKQFETLNVHCGFLNKVTTNCLPLLSDYFDSVREEACVAFEYLIFNFLPIRPEVGKENQEMLQILKA